MGIYLDKEINKGMYDFQGYSILGTPQGAPWSRTPRFVLSRIHYGHLEKNLVVAVPITLRSAWTANYQTIFLQ